MRNWVLPEYIEDILPPEAEAIEQLRRTLIDHFRANHYRLVQPPLVEHLESLLTGTGHDLELQTFKVIDPLSGRLLGVRAELYGDAEIGADCEVLTLLLSSLSLTGALALHVDLGHVGVYRALANSAHIAGNSADSELFAALRTKDVPAIAELTARLPAAWRDAFMALPALYGPADDVLAAARAQLPDIPSIDTALSALTALARCAAPLVDAVHVDLADLRGYHYQTGASFSVFTGGEANAIGRGERYDGIGKAFGRARAATGFTLDLRQLAALTARRQ